MLVAGAIIESGIDWLTASTNDPDGYEMFRLIGSDEIKKEKRAGNEVRPASFEGYRGYQCGSVFIGELDGRMLLRISSRLADDTFRDIYPHASNVSRIDLQLTIKCDPPRPQLVTQSRYVVDRRIKNRNLKTKTRLIADSQKGDTLYIGRRVSDRFLRLYNKHTETGLPEYQHCYRLEGEYKRDVARVTARQLYQCGDHHKESVGLVAHNFQRYGIFPMTAIATRLVDRLRDHRDSTATQRLQWLRSQVRGAVSELRDAGLESELLDALGLSDLDPHRETEPYTREEF